MEISCTLASRVTAAVVAVYLRIGSTSLPAWNSMKKFSTTVQFNSTMAIIIETPVASPSARE